MKGSRFQKVVIGDAEMIDKDWPIARFPGFLKLLIQQQLKQHALL
jgi:ADP-heptose:LPS heptosyltransferase